MQMIRIQNRGKFQCRAAEMIVSIRKLHIEAINEHVLYMGRKS